MWTPGVGAKLLIITVAGHDLLDTANFSIMFDLHNTNNTVNCWLRLVNGHWAFCSRMRILAGGQILE